MDNSEIADIISNRIPSGLHSVGAQFECFAALHAEIMHHSKNPKNSLREIKNLHAVLDRILEDEEIKKLLSKDLKLMSDGYGKCPRCNSTVMIFQNGTIEKHDVPNQSGWKLTMFGTLCPRDNIIT